MLQDIGFEVPSAEAKNHLIRISRLQQGLDPFFFESYAQGGSILGIYLEAPDESLEILDRGIRIFESGRAPKAFWMNAIKLYLTRAYVSAFVKGDFKQARLDFLRASEVPRAPVYLQYMKSWLKEEGSDRNLAVRVLKVMILNTSDVDLKKRYEAKLKAYES